MAKPQRLVILVEMHFDQTKLRTFY